MNRCPYCGHRCHGSTACQFHKDSPRLHAEARGETLPTMRHELAAHKREAASTRKGKGS